MRAPAVRACSARASMSSTASQTPSTIHGTSYMRVGAAVSPVPERQVVRLLDDPRALGLGARVVAVDVVDEHVDLGCAADVGRVAESSRRLAEIDQAAAGRDLELGVQAARGARCPLLLAEAERLREELDRGRAVLVQEIGSDSLFHGAQARPPAPPCLGEMFPASG